MISVTTIPAATASATSQSVAVAVTETLSGGVCSNDKVLPQSSMNFATGTIKTIGDVTFVPITVTGSIVYQPHGTNRTRTKMYSETFTVSFTATTDNDVTITPSTDVGGFLSGFNCCRAHQYTILSSLAISIA